MWLKAFTCSLLIPGLCAVAEEPVPAFEEILKIDTHAHVFEDLPELVVMMRRINLQSINICTYGTDKNELIRQEERAEAFYRAYGPQAYFASTFDLTQRNDPEYARQVTKWLDKSFDAGAVMTKIWKEVGMEIQSPQGAFILPDDAVFQPIYAHLAKRGKPLIAHLAEPIAAWRPLDPASVHYGYYSNNPEWHVYGREDFPSHEALLAARDRILEQHPRLTVIGAHLGSMAHDTDVIAKRLDRYPNFNVDVAARIGDLSRQPRSKVLDFFIRYQDRILYGTDYEVDRAGKSQPTDEERRVYTEKAERMHRNNYRYFAGEETVRISGKDVPGLGLPREVLEKFYHANSQRLIPGVE